MLVPLKILPDVLHAPGLPHIANLLRLDNTLRDRQLHYFELGVTRKCGDCGKLTSAFYFLSLSSEFCRSASLAVLQVHGLTHMVAGS